MKICVVFDAYEQMGGGYFQSIQTAKLLTELKSKNYDIKFINIHQDAEVELVKNNIFPLPFKYQKISRFHYLLSRSKILSFFFKKLKLLNPFSVFLKKNNFDLVFFLGPSFYINCCDEINFIVNLYDLNFKLHNYFPEYRNDDNFNITKELVTKSVDRAFKILVDTNRTKKELNELFNCPVDKIAIYPFSSHLPDLWEKNKNNLNIDSIFSMLNLKKDEKYFFYPAQFWAHKNHKYIIDAINYLKIKNKLTFKFIFSGSEKGNKHYIDYLIKNKKLEKDILIFNYLNDNQILALYLKSIAIVMPTYVARSTLPLYEAFFLKIPIFYSKDILDEQLEKFVITIDLNNPNDLSQKLININSLKNEIESKKIEGYKYFVNNCAKDKKSLLLSEILSNFQYSRERWKNN